MGALFASDGIINTVNAQSNFVVRIWEWLTKLSHKYSENGLDRQKRVDVLAGKLKSIVERTYGSQEKLTAKKAEVEAKAKEEADGKKKQKEADKATAKAAREAQKSTESDESAESEQMDTEAEKRAETTENDVKMSVVGEGALIANELEPAWWFIGKDGKRRYEISDEYMEVDINGYVENPQYVKDFVKHDRLFAAYPEIKDYKVKILDVIDGAEDRFGSFDHKSKTIKIKRELNDDQAKEAFLHEIQHAIQHIEEMISGTSKESAGHYLFNKAYNEVKNTPEFNAIKSAEGKRKYVVREVERRFSDYLDANGLELKPGLERNFETASIFAYSNYYGEIEARNTADEKRREMTEADLAKKRAQNDGDVYNRAEEDAKFIDNLVEIGYTENEAKKFKIYGVDSYDNQRTDARKFDISTSAEPSREGTLGVGEDGQDDGSRSDGSERGVYGGRGVRGADTGTRGASAGAVNVLLSDNKFSLSPETDAEYLTAVESGDMETAQRIVDEEAKSDIKWSVSPSLDSDIDSVLNGAFDASRNEVYLGETSQFMIDVIGANSLALYMPASKVYSSILTREEYNKKPYYAEQDNYHGIGKEDFIDILERSENPIAAFASSPDEKGNKRLNRIVLVTDKIIKDAETGEEGYAVVVEEVDITARTGGKQVKANKAITVYPRSKLNFDISDATSDGRLLDITKKGEQLFAGKRGSNPQATIQKAVLKKNIANFWANVKWNNQKNKIYSSTITPTTTAMEDAIKNSSYYKSMQNSQKNSDRRTSTVADDADYISADLASEAEWTYNIPEPKYGVLTDVAATEFSPEKALRGVEKAKKEYNVNDEETFVLQVYVKGGAYNLTRTQRKNDRSEQSEYDAYIEKLVFDGLLKHPTYSGITYRNLDFDTVFNTEDDYADFMYKNEKGKVVNMDAFSSASKNPNGYITTGNKVVHLVIKGESARDISETFNEDQQEVIYLPGSKYLVVRVTTASDGNPLIYGKEITNNEIQKFQGSDGSTGSNSSSDRIRQGQEYDNGGVFGVGRIQERAEGAEQFSETNENISSWRSEGQAEEVKHSVSIADDAETSSQDYLEMIAETKAKKESNATLVEKLLNERGTRIDGKSVPEFLKNLIASYESEAWYGNVEKKYHELFDKVYSGKGGNIDVKTVTDMFRDIATDIFNSAFEYKKSLQELLEGFDFISSALTDRRLRV